MDVSRRGQYKTAFFLHLPRDVEPQKPIFRIGPPGIRDDAVGGFRLRVADGDGECVTIGDKFRAHADGRIFLGVAKHPHRHLGAHREVVKQTLFDHQADAAGALGVGVALGRAGAIAVVNQIDPQKQRIVEAFVYHGLGETRQSVAAAGGKPGQARTRTQRYGHSVALLEDLIATIELPCVENLRGAILPVDAQHPSRRECHSAPQGPF